MKNTAVLGFIAASAAVANAQVTYENGTYTCAKPNVAYCAGNSLGTDIIIRCNAQGKGQPGRCTDNLAGQPPLGVQPALCWQTNPTSGDAACEKNCVVYGSSGNANGTFTLPASLCTPYYTATSSSATRTSTPSQTPGATTVVSTVSTTVCTTGSTGSTGSTSITRATSVPTSQRNATITPPSTGTSTSPSRTATTTTARVTAGAAANAAGGALAVVGLIAAYVL